MSGSIGLALRHARARATRCAVIRRIGGKRRIGGIARDIGFVFDFLFFGLFFVGFVGFFFFFFDLRFDDSRKLRSRHDAVDHQRIDAVGRKQDDREQSGMDQERGNPVAVFAPFKARQKRHRDDGFVDVANHDDRFAKFVFGANVARDFATKRPRRHHRRRRRHAELRCTALRERTLRIALDDTTLKRRIETKLPLRSDALCQHQILRIHARIELIRTLFVDANRHRIAAFRIVLVDADDVIAPNIGDFEHTRTRLAAIRHETAFETDTAFLFANNRNRSIGIARSGSEATAGKPTGLGRGSRHTSGNATCRHGRRHRQRRTRSSLDRRRNLLRRHRF